MHAESNKKSNTANPAEIAKFSAMAEEWWDVNGKFKPLHQMNPSRIRYIKEKLGGDFKKLRLLDIGCGGGLLAEPLARLGAQVTAIDASEKNIKIAKLHAEKENLSIDYRFTTAEELNAPPYDVVTALEIIEHVDHVPQFIATCAARLKPGGMLFISTLNRTAKSYLTAIVGAEMVLRWLPRGTHEWKKFLKPAEIITEAEKHNLQLVAIDGFSFTPISQQWKVTKDVSVNYMLVFTK
jgi:2-polyprenyl-6-hydroxyphenyl methylase/3-demethylubiquinone-9 3-methyltransferase